MRVVFAGTPAFAVPALEAIAAAGHQVVLVLTLPDKPASRGLKIFPGPIKRRALELGLELLQPPSLSTTEVTSRLSAVMPDVIVVVAYGLILPASILYLPRYGCVNIHASLLPRWRGAAPIQRAILAGDGETGVCIMQMDEGLDTGPILQLRKLAIAPTDTGGQLASKLARLGAGEIVSALDAIASGSARAQAQSTIGANYATKIDKREARIDWRSSATHIDRQVRAFDPSPGANCEHDGAALKLWCAEPIQGAGQPGELIAIGADHFTVACGDGALRVLELQRSGGKRISTAEFLRGVPLRLGQLLGPAHP